jgi:hypothetical protein
VSAAVAVTVATWLTWRSIALGAEIGSLQRQLGDNLRTALGAARDPAARVALIVQADEPLLDRAIALASARQTLLWVTAVIWLIALAFMWRWWRARNIPPSGSEENGSSSIPGLSGQE